MHAKHSEHAKLMQKKRLPTSCQMYRLLLPSPGSGHSAAAGLRITINARANIKMFPEWLFLI